MYYDFNLSVDVIWIITPLVFCILIVRFLRFSSRGIIWLESSILITLITIPMYFNARASFGGKLFSLILLYKTRLFSYLNKNFYVYLF